MNEEELKKKKLEELQEQMIGQQEAEKKALEMESQVQSALKKFLDENARQRLSNVRLVNKELYYKAFQAIMALAQQGHVQEKLNEEQVREILMKLKNNREISIRRK